MAFNDTCHLYKVDDRDAVWRLAGDDLKTVADDEGISTERLDSVVRSVVSRYPHFTEDDAPDEEPLPLFSSGRPTNAAKQSGAAGDLEVLRMKFPALRR